MNATADPDRAHEATWSNRPPDGVDPGVLEEEALREASGHACPVCGNDDTSAMRVEQEGLDYTGFNVRCNVPNDSNDSLACDGLIYHRDFNDRED